MTVLPTENVVRQIERRAKDGQVLEARMEARNALQEYTAAACDLENSPADPIAVITAARYRELIVRLQAVDALK